MTKKENNLGLIILSLPYYLHLTLAIISLITIILCYKGNLEILLYIITIIDSIDIFYLFNYKKMILLIICIPICYLIFKDLIYGACFGILLTTIFSFLITYILNKLLNLIIRKC